MIFFSEREFEGQPLNYHRVVDNKVDFDAKTVTPIIRSWEYREAAEGNELGGVEFFVELSYGEWDPALITSTSDAVLNIPWQPHNRGYVAPPPPTLEELQQTKSLELNLAAQTQIYQGYFSDALGSTHLYPAKDKDQTNMVASVTDSYNPTNGETWLTPFWCADVDDVWQYRLHTATQIQKAGSDGKLAILAALGKNAALQAQVLLATTKEELDLIIW